MTAASFRHDRLTVRLVELDSIRTVLTGAADRLGDPSGDGWIQDDWSADGGVCLVAAIRAGASGQLRARAIDVCWHARQGDAPGAPGGVHRVPPPAVRLARVRDLTRWNDDPRRCRGDVLALLAHADALVTGEMERLRALLGLRVRAGELTVRR